jgi:hypothetical protein
MLYSVLIGLVLGLLLRGRVERLGEVRVRWAAVAVIGLVVQLVLFSGPVTRIVGAAGPPIYVASTAVVLVVVLANLHLPGLPLVALGAASNLVAIFANGGYMPASPEALAALGKTLGSEYSNSSVGDSIALAPLTDIYALPAWLPMANVFSIGDVLLGAGIAIAIVTAMRDARLDPGRPASRSEPPLT